MLRDSRPHINNGEEMGTFNNEEQVDCAVCLCKIGGDDATVLKCKHVFHRHCLDTWVGLKNVTCPLCRRSLDPRRTLTDFGAEVLLFQFCSVRNDERETWWLR
ncbi:hypothetical protein RJT34_07127 [Clitoria ternatea]|uniref:RING-type domain-containing protein n=1 Tax=Clitoria ternatea TaxID=43366 RepID=A0AAN9PU18_CLITE